MSYVGVIRSRVLCDMWFRWLEFSSRIMHCAALRETKANTCIRNRSIYTSDMEWSGSWSGSICGAERSGAGWGLERSGVEWVCDRNGAERSGVGIGLERSEAELLI